MCNALRVMDPVPHAQEIERPSIRAVIKLPANKSIPSPCANHCHGHQGEHKSHRASNPSSQNAAHTRKQKVSESGLLWRRIVQLARLGAVRSTVWAADFDRRPWRTQEM